MHSVAQNKIVFYSSFDDLDKFTKHLLKVKNISLVKEEGVGKTTALKVSYVPSNRGSERVVTAFKLDKSYKELSLNFDLKYHKDFDWAKGGKLHGVGPAKPITGGKKMTKDGWSSRLMFFAKGKIGTYIYNQSKNKKYGEIKIADINMRANQYYAISLYTKLNSPGKANGEIHCYVDGTLKIKLTKQMLRGDVSDDTAQIQQILFNTFHGGHSPDWTPRKDNKPATCFAFFDNFAAYEGLNIRKSIGCRP